MESLFINPGLVAAGGALIASPIIIHIINRLRYRRVRFAAMEFLLQSQKKNRRRILLEQLLLLLLRILIVIAIVLLISRLIFSPTALAELKGEASSHHVILIDDSGSMREVTGAKSAFVRAKDAAIRMVDEKGVQAPGTQRFTVLFLSKLLKGIQNPFLENREANESSLDEMKDHLKGVECTYQHLKLEAGMIAAADRLRGNKQDAATTKFLHVLSDYRNDDWKTDTAIAETVKQLTDPSGDDEQQKARNRISVNFIRAAAAGQPNLAIVKIEAEVETAAVGVPIPISVTVKNFGKSLVENVKIYTYRDGSAEPDRVVFAIIDKIKPGTQESKTSWVQFSRAGSHRIKLKLAELKNDGIADDNEHWVAIENLRPRNRVLLIDGDPQRRNALDVQDALASNPALSGIEVNMQGADWLGNNKLEPYQCIYMLDVAQLTPKAIRSLTAYVARGGGLAWFLGRRVQAAHYNANLYSVKLKSVERGLPRYELTGIFPVPLADTHQEFLRLNPEKKEQDFKLVDEKHPILNDLAAMFFPDAGHVERHWAVAANLPRSSFSKQDKAEDVTNYVWQRKDNQRRDGSTTIARMNNGIPLMLVHQFDRGAVFTCLTMPDRKWTNWPTLNHYFVLMMRVRDYIVQIGPKRVDRQRLVGIGLSERVPKSEFDREAQLISPQFQYKSIKIQATDEVVAPKSNTAARAGKTTDGKTGSKSAADSEGNPKKKVSTHQIFKAKDTGLPGVYTLKLRRRTKSAATGLLVEDRMFAYNVPASESATELFPKDKLEERFANNEFVQVFSLEDEIAYSGQEPGREVRIWLLFILVGLLIAEQLLAYRLSYHTRDA